MSPAALHVALDAVARLVYRLTLVAGLITLSRSTHELLVAEQERVPIHHHHHHHCCLVIVVVVVVVVVVSD